MAYYIIHKGENFTGCYTIQKRDEVLLPPPQLGSWKPTVLQQRMLRWILVAFSLYRSSNWSRLSTLRTISSAVSSLGLLIGHHAIKPGNPRCFLNVTDSFIHNRDNNTTVFQRSAIFPGELFKLCLVRSARKGPSCGTQAVHYNKNTPL